MKEKTLKRKNVRETEVNKVKYERGSDQAEKKKADVKNAKNARLEESFILLLFNVGGLVDIRRGWILEIMLVQSDLDIFCPKQKWLLENISDS